MSGLYIKDWSERVTLTELLQIHSELKELLQIPKSEFKLWLKPDYFSNTNLFLPNPIIEKSDYWDIDTFLYMSQQGLREYYLHKLKDSRVEKISKNDLTYSLLFKSNIWKKVQIDLHLIPLSPQTKANYFHYYRVPYLFFVLWIMFNRVKIKYWTLWVKYLYKLENWQNLETKIANNSELFLKQIFDISYEEYVNITSYKEIANLLIKKWLSDYDFFTNVQKAEYKRKLEGNSKLEYILSLLPDPYKTLEDFKEDYMSKIYETFTFLKDVERQYNENAEKSLEEKRIREEWIKKIFNVSQISEIDNNMKPLLGNIKSQLNEYLILKEMTDKVKEKYPNYTLYLVWWWVRDLLLWKKNNDFDLSWPLTPDEFIDLFWWKATDKFWTVFYKKDNLEIEYTPFRSEKWYNGRIPETITFSKDIKEDAKRRDFTINQLYIDCYNFTLYDFYNWLSDLKKKIVKTVENPYDRFNEDYLRILRWLRLAAKIWWIIDPETYQAMKDLNKKLEWLSDSRTLEEYMKGLNLWWISWRNYLQNLSNYYNEAWIKFSLLEEWDKYNKWEVYTLLYWLTWKDEKRLSLLHSKFRWKKFATWSKARDIYTREWISFKTKEDFVRSLVNSKVNKEYINVLIKSLGNLWIQEWKFTKDDINELLLLKKELDKEWIKYTYNELKDVLSFSSKEEFQSFVKEKNIHPKDVKDYLIRRYYSQFPILKENIKIEDIDDDFELDDFLIDDFSLEDISQKYYSIFDNTDKDLERYKWKKYRIIQKWKTQLISIYKNDECIEKNLKQWEYVEKRIEEIISEEQKERAK